MALKLASRGVGPSRVVSLRPPVGRSFMVERMFGSDAGHRWGHEGPEVVGHLLNRLPQAPGTSPGLLLTEQRSEAQPSPVEGLLLSSLAEWTITRQGIRVGGHLGLAMCTRRTSLWLYRETGTRPHRVGWVVLAGSHQAHSGFSRWARERRVCGGK